MVPIESHPARVGGPVGWCVAAVSSYAEDAGASRDTAQVVMMDRWLSMRIVSNPEW